MMKMICDRCGQEIKSITKYWRVVAKEQNTWIEFEGDICASCVCKLKTFLEMNGDIDMFIGKQGKTEVNGDGE